MRANSLVVVLVVILQGASAASALERTKTRPPTSAEAQRIASELAMDDSSLQKGDIVSTIAGSLSNAASERTDTPEPSIWAMMIPGFVGLGFLGHRRRMPCLTRALKLDWIRKARCSDLAD
jgi:hypothetical protein